MIKPNIIFIVADDMGYSDLGWYGGEIKTPHLDKMAHEGVMFSNMHNASMCVLSRSSVLSGKWWPKSGKGISHGENIAQELQKNGYRTGIVGKWHLNGTPNAKGFDYFFGFLRGFSNYFTGSEDYRINQTPFTSFDPNFYSTDAFTDSAVNFINPSKENGKPFFLYLCYQSPHNPFTGIERRHYEVPGDLFKGLAG